MTIEGEQNSIILSTVADPHMYLIVTKAGIGPNEQQVHFVPVSSL